MNEHIEDDNPSGGFLILLFGAAFGFAMGFLLFRMLGV